MSDNISNIKNSIYKFNFSLSKITGDTKTNVFIPVTKGMVRYLEIDDNLANIGYVGTVIFSNFYGILDKLGLGAGISDSTTLFDISIENLDFKGTNIQDNSIQALVILQNNTDPSNNTIDKSIIYSFEEYSVNLLKQQKLTPSTVSGKITDSIYSLLEKVFNDSSVINKESFSLLSTSSNEMSVDTSILKTNSYFDFLKILYKYLLLTGLNNSPGLIQLENFLENVKGQDSVVRKFNIKPLFSKIRSLISKLETSNRDLSDEVLEQLTIGGESTKPAYRENIVETLTVLRPDFKSLYENKWINYTGVTTLQNLTDVIGLNIKYDDLRTGFQRDALVNKQSNLPVRVDIKPADTIEKVIAFDYPIVSDSNLLEQGITSMLYKSFIYDNTAVVFKTLGNPYRKPGSFIRLNGGDEGDKNSSVTGYWFIIGIKHIFENEIYSNEITAVKIFIEEKGGLVSTSETTSNPSISRAPTSQPSNANLTTINSDQPDRSAAETDFIDPNNINNTSNSSTLNDAQLPTADDNNDDGPSNSLFPDISEGEPTVDTSVIEQSVTEDNINVDVPIPEGIPF